MLWRLPNVHELVASEAALEASSPRGNVRSAKHEEPLYLAVFGRNVLTLRRDVEDNPTKYRPELFQWLIKHPTLPEKVDRWATGLLSEAVLDFYNRKPKVEPPPTRSAEEAPEEEGVEELYEPAPDLSGREPFWWLK